MFWRLDEAEKKRSYRLPPSVGVSLPSPSAFRFEVKHGERLPYEEAPAFIFVNKNNCRKTKKYSMLGVNGGLLPAGLQLKIQTMHCLCCLLMSPMNLFFLVIVKENNFLS